MDELRLSLFVIGILLICSIYLWDKVKYKRYKLPSITSGKKYLAALQHKIKAKLVANNKEKETVSENLKVIFLRVAKGQIFSGEDILKIVNELNLRYGQMNIFHYHRNLNENEPILFSMANILEPGTFILQDITALKTKGVVFFVHMKGEKKQDKNAINLMSIAAKKAAGLLSGKLYYDSLEPLQKPDNM